MNALIGVARAAPAAASARALAAGPICRIDIVRDLSQAATIWDSLDACGALRTPYQRYDWVCLWQRHVGARNAVEPLLVVGRGVDGAPLFLWPLGIQAVGPFSVARFLGGKHTNFNLGLWRRDLAASITAAELRGVLERIRLSSSVDLLALTNQPESWDGIANPLARLRHQPSPSFGHAGVLANDFESLLRARLQRTARRKLRQKHAALAAHGPVRYWRAETAEQVRAVLDAFFVQKAERMRELGVADMFAIPGTRQFIAAAASEGLAEARPAIELYACSVGDTIVSTYAGVVDRGRFCGVFNSIIRNDLARESPGQLLMLNLVRMCCERGLDTFDLGVGEARFKQMFCDRPEPLFDSFLPLTALGHAAASACRLHQHVKRRIKHSPAVWGAFTTLRRRLNAGRAVPGGD